VAAIVVAALPVMAGVGDAILIGLKNVGSAETEIQGSESGPLVRFDNKHSNGNAARFEVTSGNSPFTVNSGKKVTNLNADKLDGKSSSFYMQQGTIVTVEADWHPWHAGPDDFVKSPFGAEWTADPEYISQTLTAPERTGGDRYGLEKVEFCIGGPDNLVADASLVYAPIDFAIDLGGRVDVSLDTDLAEGCYEYTIHAPGGVIYNLAVYAPTGTGTIYIGPVKTTWKKSAHTGGVFPTAPGSLIPEGTSSR
jgi:hypothetical protein